MSFFSKLFGGKKKTISQEPLIPKWQEDLGKQLADWAKQYISSYVPGAEYKSLTKLMTPTFWEQTALEKLTDYMKQPIPTLIPEAKEEISKTLKGEYDPYTSEYYKAMKKGVERERKERLRSLNNLMAKYGLRSSSYRGKGLSDLEEETFEKLSQLLATLSENERIRRLQVLPYALETAKFEEMLPVQRIQTGMQYGSLPRLLEQIGYEDFLRKQKELQFPYSVALSTFGRQIPYGVKSFSYKTKSPFMSFLQNVALPLALAAINPAAGATAAGASIIGGQGGIGTGMQGTPFGGAPTWSPYNPAGQRIFLM